MQELKPIDAEWKSCHSSVVPRLGTQESSFEETVGFWMIILLSNLLRRNPFINISFKRFVQPLLVPTHRSQSYYLKNQLFHLLDWFNFYKILWFEISFLNLWVQIKKNKTILSYNRPSNIREGLGCPSKSLFLCRVNYFNHLPREYYL